MAFLLHVNFLLECLSVCLSINVLHGLIEIEIEVAEAEVSLGARFGLVAFQLVRRGEDLATDFTCHGHWTLVTRKTR